MNLSSNSPTDKKASLFDDSFFEDDEDGEDDEVEDDDLNFDDEENEELESHEEARPAPSSVAQVPKTNMQSVSGARENVSQILPGSGKAESPSKMSTDDHHLTQNIQFRLGCEIGQVLIPYENLQNLNVGHVVDFNNTVQSLYLTINNVRVGEGMLVDIDGKVGIKITRWYGKV
jgi:flagellar motor switch/type III secretory pathway protein FliN